MPFKPGQSGNPGGRPKKKLFREALTKVLDAAGEDSEKLTAIAQALYDKAKTGDVSAIKEVRDTLDGKPAQAIIGGEEDDPPIRISTIEIVAAGEQGQG
jgi:hypothetical protein